jgi:hypothetical protein
MYTSDAGSRFISNAKQYTSLSNEKLQGGLGKNEVIRHQKSNVATCRSIMMENNSFIDTNLKPFFKEPRAISAEEAENFLAFAKELHHPVYSNADDRIKYDSFLALDIYKALLKYAEAQGQKDLELQCWFYIGDIYYLLAGGAYAKDSIDATVRAMEIGRELGGYHKIADRTTRLCAAASPNQLAISYFNYAKAEYEDIFKAIEDARNFYTDESHQALDPDFPWKSWLDDVEGNIYYMGTRFEFIADREVTPIRPDLANRQWAFCRQHFEPKQLARLESDDLDEVQHVQNRLMMTDASAENGSQTADLGGIDTGAMGNLDLKTLKALVAMLEAKQDGAEAMR